MKVLASGEDLKGHIDSLRQALADQRLLNKNNERLLAEYAKEARAKDQKHEQALKELRSYYITTYITSYSKGYGRIASQYASLHTAHRELTQKVQDGAVCIQVDSEHDATHFVVVKDSETVTVNIRPSYQKFMYQPRSARRRYDKTQKRKANRRRVHQELAEAESDFFRWEVFNNWRSQ